MTKLSTSPVVTWHSGAMCFSKLAASIPSSVWLETTSIYAGASSTAGGSSATRLLRLSGTTAGVQSEGTTDSSGVMERQRHFSNKNGRNATTWPATFRG